MTVCIASICANGNGIVVASDRMLSAHYLDLEFEHHDQKLKKLCDNCVALSAGDALITTEIYNEIESEIEQAGAFHVSDLTYMLRDRYTKSRRRLIEQTIFGTRGMSQDDFYSGRMQALIPDISFQIDRDAQSFNLGTSLIVAGVDTDGAQVFAIENPGMEMPMDRVGFHAIGSGQRHALLTLVGVGQNRDTDLKQTLVNVLRAKRRAQVAPGVGAETDIAIINHAGTNYLTDEELAAMDDIVNEFESAAPDNISQRIDALNFGE